MALLDDNQIEGSDLTPKSVELLKGTTIWMNILGIIGLIGLAYYVILLFTYAQYMLAMGGALGLILVLIGATTIAVLIWSFILLLQYSNNLKKFGESRNSSDLEKAFAKQKMYWTVLGIFTIVSIVLSIILNIISRSSF